MAKHEIKLTEKQSQIINNIFSIKQALEAEYKRATERESEFIVNLCEAKEIEAVHGIEIKDGIMYVPVEEPVKAPKAKEVKLKQKE